MTQYFKQSPISFPTLRFCRSQAEKEEQAAKEQAQQSKAVDVDVAPVTTLASESWATEPMGFMGASTVPATDYTAPTAAAVVTEDWSAEANEQWSEQVETNEWSTNTQWSA